MKAIIAIMTRSSEHFLHFIDTGTEYPRMKDKKPPVLLIRGLKATAKWKRRTPSLRSAASGEVWEEGR
jgi:hypothetical protein